MVRLFTWGRRITTRLAWRGKAFLVGWEDSKESMCYSRSRSGVVVWGPILPHIDILQLFLLNRMIKTYQNLFVAFGYDLKRSSGIEWPSWQRTNSGCKSQPQCSVKNVKNTATYCCNMYIHNYTHSYTFTYIHTHLNIYIYSIHIDSS